ncbi:MAG: hypothetical protein R3223_13510 [Longimicrobiales bacterium]|nr:hypothetical protein [Longimicrobiales bacterium]
MTAFERSPRAGLYVSSLVVLCAACSLWPGSDAPNPMVRGRPTSVGVVVENQHWSDMVVYVVSGGSSRRLGMVTTTNRESFELSRNLLTSSLYLRAEAVGSSRSIRTDVLSVAEGDVIVWTLANQLGLSHYEIR